VYDVVVGGVPVDVASDTGVACLGAETAQGWTVGARLHDLRSAAKATRCESGAAHSRGTVARGGGCHWHPSLWGR
jgi:hypothetical protein